jgi:UPF0716 protein FxsA
MVAVLVMVFVVVPLIELAVIITVAGAIGVVPTILALVAVSVLGAWLVKREGVGVMRRMQASLDRGEMPARELLDGVLLMAAGVLCVVPGFVTDAFGLLLLTPPVRAFVRNRVTRRLERTGTIPGFGRGSASATFVDVEWIGDVTPPRRPPSEPIELGPGHD